MLNAYPVAVDDQAIVAEPAHGGDQDPMLRAQDSSGEARLVIAVVYRDRGLRNDRSVIDILRDEMNRAAVHLDAVGERLAMRVKARVRRQKGRVDVEHPAPVTRDKVGAEHAHESG